MSNFCPKCGAPLAGVSAEAKFCPKCGAAFAVFSAPAPAPAAPVQPVHAAPAPAPAAPVQPVSAAPAKPSATYCFDLPSRMQYIIAMVCLAVGIVVSILLDAESGVEEPSADRMTIFALLNAVAMLYPCIVIKKILSYKRGALGLWATRAVYAMYAVIGFLPLCIYVSVQKCMTPDDFMTLLSQVKTGILCLSIVEIAAFAALGFAIIDLKDHAKSGRWFIATGAALILVTALSFISDMHYVINFEEMMMNDELSEPSSWWESIPLSSIVLLFLFIGGYMFLSDDDVRGRYGRVEDNPVESYGGGGILLLALWRGVRVLDIRALFIAPVVFVAWACYMIKYVPLPSADASSADAPKEGNTEPAVVADAKPAAESSPAAVPATPAPVPTSTSTPAAEPVKGKVTNPEVEKMLKEDGPMWKQIITVVIVLAIVGLLLYFRYERKHKEAEKAHEELEVFMEKYR